MSQMPASSAADARFELASAAMRRERANRPTTWLVAAALVLVAVLIYLAVAFYKSVNAEKALAREITTTRDVLRMTSEIHALAATATERGRAGIGEPIPDLFSRLQAAARDAGMSTDLGAPRTSNDRPSGMPNVNGKRYEYANVHEESLESVLTWIERSTRSVPGLELHTLALKPEPRSWQVRVVFRRWERTGGT